MNAELEKKTIVIRREPNHGLGLSIAGGVESTPFMVCFT